jgi:ParB family chromosome partitioning protein
MAKKGLGRGLDALLGDAPAEEKSKAAGDSKAGGDKLPIEFLLPNADQPRKHFAPQEIADLATSIREKGLLQPILVRPVARKKDTYEIVAGERRWRAAQKAQLHEVPVLIREFSDAEAAEIALIENIQRVDLNPIEEAEGYAWLMKQHKHTQAQVADAVGKSRSHVANMLRLITLPQSVRDKVREGALSMGHARAILSAADPEALAAAVIADGLSVRETEAKAKASHGGDDTKSGFSSGTKKSDTKATSKDADTRALERDISETLGLEVDISHKGKKGGSLTINYTTLDQLDDIVGRLMNVGV